jgi:hypothetical protein
MSATAAQIARLRRMVAEPTEDPYDDDTLSEYIERYPLLDERGEQPYTWDTSTEPPTRNDNDSWFPTYDLHAAAADVWEEKAAGVADSVDFGADGANYHLSQKYEQAMARVRYHRARRSPTTHTLVKWPEERNSAELYPWIGNLPEPDD